MLVAKALRNFFDFPPDHLGRTDEIIVATVGRPTVRMQGALSLEQPT